jgi:hypothetical protein
MCTFTPKLMKDTKIYPFKVFKVLIQIIIKCKVNRGRK